MLGKLKRAFIPHKHNGYRPHALRHKWLSIYTLGLIVSQFAFGLAFYTGPINTSEVILTSNIVHLSNVVRNQKGLQTLTENKALTTAAYDKLNDMFQKNYWDHKSPDGTEAWYFIKKEGYDYNRAGENLARGFTNANSVFNAWMSSPTHRANILESRYQDIGIAVGTGNFNGRSTTIIVQLFGTQRAYAQPSNMAIASPKNSIVQNTETVPLALGEKTTKPTFSLYNAASTNKLPYLVLWGFILVLIIFDFSMLRHEGKHKLQPHRLHLQTAVALSIFFFVILTVSVVSIA